ncbi:MAG TPA: primosomal replication protein N [Methylophilaceae bacterium]|nr:primosomal replication protein N [Methylophilaceae bacterium]
MSSNKLELTGEVVQIEILRYTPAGIPLLSFVLRHLSEQLEAGMQRRVECEVNAMLMGELAEKSQGIKVGALLKVAGFIARRSLKSTQLVLHITTLDII